MKRVKFLIPLITVFAIAIVTTCGTLSVSHASKRNFKAATGSIELTIIKDIHVKEHYKSKGILINHDDKCFLYKAGVHTIRDVDINSDPYHLDVAEDDQCKVTPVSYVIDLLLGPIVYKYTINPF
jgi:hypothetical protein